MQLRCGGIFNNRFIANFLQSVTVKELLKSVDIWQRCWQTLPPKSTAFQRGVSGAPTKPRKTPTAWRNEKYKLPYRRQTQHNKHII